MTSARLWPGYSRMVVNCAVFQPRDFGVHTLSVTEERVAAIAAGFGLDLPAADKRPETFPVPHSVMQNVRARLANLQEESRIIPSEHVGEILGALVPLWLSGVPDGKFKRPSLLARDRAIQRSLEIIEATDIRQLTPDVLLENCHVSERTLQYAFRESFAMSPAALIKSLRMAQVRSALLNASPNEHQIGDIAAEHGFWHLSQFAQDYRKRFGERPSETLASESP